MWSASSSTVTSTPLRSAAPRSIRSSSRPGVAMTTSTPRSNARSCGCTTSRRPPGSARGSGSRPAVPARRAPASRAPGSAPAPGPARPPERPRDPARRVSIGRPKASVLPEPVWPRPRTSRPASASGMVAAWIGKGLVMPPAAGPRRGSSAVRARRSTGGRRALVDVVDASGAGASRLTGRSRRRRCRDPVGALGPPRGRSIGASVVLARRSYDFRSRSIGRCSGDQRSFLGRSLLERSLDGDPNGGTTVSARMVLRRSGAAVIVRTVWSSGHRRSIHPTVVTAASCAVPLDE